jgi:tRNA(Arg) A34 adenosine deaminase TadA
MRDRVEARPDKARRPERDERARGRGSHESLLSSSSRSLDSLGNRAMLALLRSGRLQRSARQSSQADANGREADRTAVLGEGTRSLMESRFGESFSGVRVHTGDRAAAAAADVHARAFTVGEDIIFADGEFAPETAQGQWLLAHELAHVVQQRRPGAPDGTHDAERDARNAATDIAEGAAPTVRATAPAGVVQRDDGEDLWTEVPTYSTPARGGASIFASGSSGGQSHSWHNVADLISGDDSTPEVVSLFAAEHGEKNQTLSVVVGVKGSKPESKGLPSGRWKRVEVVVNVVPDQPEPEPEPGPAPAPKPRPAPKPPPTKEPPKQPPPLPTDLHEEVEEEAPPDLLPQKLERLRRHMDEKRWDVDDYAARLTTEELRRLSLEDRLRLIKEIADGYVVGDEDEDTLNRLIDTTSDEDAAALIDKFRDDPELLRRLHSVIDGEENVQYHEIMRNLYLRSMTDPAAALERMTKATHTLFLDPAFLKMYATGHTRYEMDFSGSKIQFQSWWIPQVPLGEFQINAKTDLDPFDMVAVHFGNSEDFFGGRQGSVVYMPAYSLLKLDNKQFKHELEIGGNALLVVAGGAGLAAATTRGAAALAALDLTIGAGSFIVEAEQENLSKTPEGRAFLKTWHIANALVGAYSLGRVVAKAPGALRSARDAYKAFKEAGGLSQMDPGQAAKLEAEMQKMAAELDEAEKATAGGGPGSINEPPVNTPTAIAAPAPAPLGRQKGLERASKVKDLVGADVGAVLETSDGAVIEGSSSTVVQPRPPGASAHYKHAEIDVLIEGTKNGRLAGKSAVLYVTEHPCAGACLTTNIRGNIVVLFEQSGMTSLTIHSPEATIVLERSANGSAVVSSYSVR